MGVKCSFFILLCVFCASFLQISLTAVQRGFTVCDIQGCNCTVKAASWKVINCSLHGNKVNKDQSLLIFLSFISTKIVNDTHNRLIKDFNHSCLS